MKAKQYFLGTHISLTIHVMNCYHKTYNQETFESTSLTTQRRAFRRSFQMWSIQTSNKGKMTFTTVENTIRKYLLLQQQPPKIDLSEKELSRTTRVTFWLLSQTEFVEIQDAPSVVISLLTLNTCSTAQLTVEALWLSRIEAAETYNQWTFILLCWTSSL